MTRRPRLSPDELFAEGIGLHKGGRLAEAEARYRRLLDIAPRHARARYLLGTLLHQNGDPAGAIVEIERAIRQEPNVPAMHINLGGAYLAVGRIADAVAASRNALRLEPSPQAYFNLGEALRKLGDWENAAAAYENYVRLNPTDGVGHSAHGDALKKRGRLDAAMAAFEMAMAYLPNHAATHIGVGDVLVMKGCHNAALTILERVVGVAPTNPDVRRRCGEIKLSLGDLPSGWDEFDEGRFGAAGGVVRRPTPPAYWQGEDLAGKRLIVWNEQGVGDECLYASILPDVIARAKHCIVACSERMAPTFARSFPDAEVRGWDGLELPVRTGDGLDYQVASGSLGRYLRRDFASFPKHTGYLKADPVQRALIREKYQTLAGGRRIVGIAFTSKTAIPGSGKSAEIARLGALLKVPGVMFVNLQYGDCAEAIAAARASFGVEIYHDPEIDQLADIGGYFAQVAAMDLVISTSNSTVHVAGSMNIPTWLMLPAGRGGHWYWFLRREDSPWYPSLKIIRASSADLNQPWETVTGSKAGADLTQWVKAEQTLADG